MGGRSEEKGLLLVCDTSRSPFSFLAM